MRGRSVRFECIMLRGVSRGSETIRGQLTGSATLRNDIVHAARVDRYAENNRLAEFSQIEPYASHRNFENRSRPHRRNMQLFRDRSAGYSFFRLHDRNTC